MEIRRRMGATNYRARTPHKSHCLTPTECCTEDSRQVLSLALLLLLHVGVDQDGVLLLLETRHQEPQL
jgi:hypothetical protein